MHGGNNAMCSTPINGNLVSPNFDFDENEESVHANYSIQSGNESHECNVMDESFDEEHRVENEREEEEAQSATALSDESFNVVRTVVFSQTSPKASTSKTMAAESDVFSCGVKRRLVFDSNDEAARETDATTGKTLSAKQMLMRKIEENAKAARKRREARLAERRTKNAVESSENVVPLHHEEKKNEGVATKNIKINANSIHPSEWESKKKTVNVMKSKENEQSFNAIENSREIIVADDMDEILKDIVTPK